MLHSVISFHTSVFQENQKGKLFHSRGVMDEPGALTFIAPQTLTPEEEPEWNLELRVAQRVCPKATPMVK